MKKCRKLSEPPTLEAYRLAQPQGSWDQMRNDSFYGGQQAYTDVKRTLVRGQRCLCAYCEIEIAGGMDDAGINAKKHEQRVEHFHPKEDRSATLNWALHWSNLWAVCPGGSQRPPDGIPFDPSRYLPPLPANLSCDAFKDHQIQAGKLPASPEGWLLAPDEVPAFPLLFQFAPNGTPEPHPQNCGALALPGSHYPNTTTLVSKTIEHLNLGCPRLNRNRCIAKAQLEKQIRKAQQSAPGVPPQSVMLDLARRLLSQGADSPWPQYFSLVRWRLGDPAEAHLQSLNYAG